MAEYDAGTVECFVFTEKEGLLSRVAHDLKLRVMRLTLKLDDASGAVDATFDPASLRVECATVEGRESPGALSASDRDKIEATMRDEVLHVGRHPEVRFRSTRVVQEGDDYALAGDLALHGITRPLRLVVRRVHDGYETEAVLHQPDFGIKPYRAALGALKVKPDVRVWIRVPHTGAPASVDQPARSAV